MCIRDRTKPTARAASTTLAFEHASDLAASADNAIKRMCDIFAALFGIILLTPLWIIVALMVRLNDGGPAFFTQERVGLARVMDYLAVRLAGW